MQFTGLELLYLFLMMGTGNDSDRSQAQAVCKQRINQRADVRYLWYYSSADYSYTI